MTEDEFIEVERNFVNGNEAQWIYGLPTGAKSGKNFGSFQIPYCTYCGCSAPTADINGRVFIVLKKKCPCCGRQMSKHYLVAKEPFIIDETE